MSTPKRRVAIACQGGGSHTAFTAGALSRLLSPEILDEYEIVGLSGTSGGAICAAIAWTALVERRPEDAVSMLRSFWQAISATSWSDQMVNNMVLWGSRVAEVVAVPAVSPYMNVGAALSSRQLARLVDQTVDLAAAQERALASLNPPMLLLGAVDVLRGRFHTFDSRDGEITTEAILASAAIPNLFQSVKIGNKVYWDGLFSQNPPVGQLDAVHPDEIWVIQINPSQIDHEPQNIADITSRRNELAGNLSLNQELGHLEQIAGWLADGTITSETIKPTTVRILEMSRTESSIEWGYTSKLNRDPAFIQELMDLGVTQAERMIQALAFEQAWDDDDEDLWDLVDRFAPEVEVSSSHPLAPLEPTNDRERIHTFLKEFGFRVETARKRVCEANVRWTIRSLKDPRIRARVEVSFLDHQVTRFTVYDA